MSVKTRAASEWWRPIVIALGLVVSKLRILAVPRALCCVLGCCTICLSTGTLPNALPFCTFWPLISSGSFDNLLAVRVLWDNFICADIVTDCISQRMFLRSDQKISWIKRSMDKIPREMSAKRRGATPNKRRIFSFLEQRWSRSYPTEGSSYFVAVKSCRAFWRLMP